MVGEEAVRGDEPAAGAGGSDVVDAGGYAGGGEGVFRGAGVVRDVGYDTG